jgi:DNA-binding MarR family transcriptional regulator
MTPVSVVNRQRGATDISRPRRIVLSDMRERASKPLKRLDDGDYAALAGFRSELRGFLFFSEQAARKAGIAPQQHQALLSIRGAADGTQTVGELARRLLIRSHSASGLVSRLQEQGLLERVEAPDRRLATLRLTDKAEDLLALLARTHLAELRRMRPLLRGLMDLVDPEKDAAEAA